MMRINIFVIAVLSTLFSSIALAADLYGGFAVVDDVAPKCTPDSCYRPDVISNASSSCICPVAASTRLSFRALNDCNGKGTLHGSFISACMVENWISKAQSVEPPRSLPLSSPLLGSSLPHTSFGGAFQRDDKVRQGVGCRAANPLTGSCHCPKSFNELSMRVMADCAAPGCEVGTTVTFCVSAFASPHSVFDGAFQVNEASGACVVPNPLSGGAKPSCGCSAETSHQQHLPVLLDGNVASSIRLCFKSAAKTQKVWPPAPPPQHDPLVLYIATNGKDTNNGKSPATALATLDRAFEIVSDSRPLGGGRRQRRQRRAASENLVWRNVTINIAGGIYFLNETASIDNVVGGSKDDNAVTTIQAFPAGARVVLSGATPVQGWRPSVAAPGVVETTLDRSIFKQKMIWQAFRLHSSSPQPLSSSRIPLQETPVLQYATYAPSKTATTPSVVTATPQQMHQYFSGGRLSNSTRSYVRVYHDWTSSISAVQSVAPHTGDIVLAGTDPDNNFLNAGRKRYAALNVNDAAAMEPDTLLFDDATSTLSVKAGSPEQILVPRLRTVLHISGDDVVVRGIELAHTDAFLDETCIAMGCAGQSASVLTDAALEIFGRRVTFTHGGIALAGQYAAWLRPGAYLSAIRHTQMRDLAAGGVRIGDPTSLTTGVAVEDCGIQRTSLLIQAGTGILAQQVASVSIQHNLIRETGYTSVSVGWTWTWAPTRVESVSVRKNRLGAIGATRGRDLTDLGCVYTLGEQPGTVIDNNICSDVQNNGYGAWGYYNDQASRFITLRNNIAYRNAGAGLHIHFGLDLTIENCVFAFQQRLPGIVGGEFALVRSSPAPSGWEAQTGFNIERNILLARNASAHLFFETTPQAFANRTGYMIQNNTYFNLADGAGGVKDLHFPVPGCSSEACKTWTGWQAYGWDRGGIRADPQFVNAAHYDFSELQPTSPAIARGFKPIKTSDVGPRSD